MGMRSVRRRDGRQGVSGGAEAGGARAGLLVAALTCGERERDKTKTKTKQNNKIC